MTSSPKSPASVEDLATRRRRAVVQAALASGALVDTTCCNPAGLEDLVEEGRIKTGWVWIDPEMARAWLGSNHGNRPVSPHTVRAYAQDMRNGQWMPNHQGIAFDARHHLIDGQHRLHAIIMAGVKVRMQVTTGLAHRLKDSQLMTMDTVDRGRPRSVSDQLRVQHGMTDTTTIAGLCSALAKLCNDQKTRKLSVGQTLEIFEAFRDPIAWTTTHRSKKEGIRQMGVLAAFTFAMAAVGPNAEGDVQQHYFTFANGQAAPCTPLGQLHAFITSDEGFLLTRGSDRGLAELTLHALWLHAQGRTVARLQPSLDALHHYRALQPDRVAQIAALFTLPELDAA